MTTYVIIKRSQRFVQGDERSRTNPGHGYPAHYEEISEFIEYSDHEEWKSDVEVLAKRGANFKAGSFEEVKPRITVEIDL
jgi:hypothetical protein